MFSFTSSKPFVNATVYRKNQENKGENRIVNEVNGKITKKQKSFTEEKSYEKNNGSQSNNHRN